MTLKILKKYGIRVDTVDRGLVPTAGMVHFGIFTRMIYLKT